jgi:hypothetical protein
MSTDNPQRSMHSQTIADIATETGGRWQKNSEVRVTGQSPMWVPPTINGSGPWATPDPVPAEEPLGTEIDWVPDMTTVDGSPRELLAPVPDTNPEEPQ